MTQNTVIIPEKLNHERLDKGLAELLGMTRSGIQTLLKDDAILVNGEKTKANYKCKTGDEITYIVREAEELDIEAEDIPLDIYYEDTDVLVVNKPQGMVVHPSAGHTSGTLVNALLFHCKDLSGINGKIRPGIVHRIDKDTSGLLMVAKNDKAHESLAEQLYDKTSDREYIALVHGVIKHQKGTIDAPIGRSKEDRQKMGIVNDGKESRTHFEVLERFKGYTLIKCRLETGRTHQIRVHMKYIGHPLAGDPKYGLKNTIKGEGQFLHASELGFTHPTTGERMMFEAPLPEVFQEALESLRE